MTNLIKINITRIPKEYREEFSILIRLINGLCQTGMKPIDCLKFVVKAIDELGRK